MPSWWQQCRRDAHWVLDVTMNENQQRTRGGNGAENMVMMRRMAFNRVRGMVERKKTERRSKLKRAGWYNDFLLEIIQATRYAVAEPEKVQVR